MNQNSAPHSYVTRLAPSPTGALHLGNARSFLITWLRCRARGGKLLLRLEDLDHPRVKPWAVQQVYDDLRWLGLDWDEGPADSFGLPPPERDPFIQSHRLPLYAEAFERLRAASRIYPCTCTRRDVESAQSAPHAGEDLVYPGTCRGRYTDAAAAEAASGRAPAWRFEVPRKISWFHDGFHGNQTAMLAELGDFVVARGADQPAYQLGVVVDDIAMGITEVIRGDDLLSSAHRQILLYLALGATPPAFFHLPLVIGEDGRRLAKRHGDTRLSHLREKGVPPERVVGWLASTCGWAASGDELTPRDLLPRYTEQTIPKTPVVVDQATRQLLEIES